MERGKGKLRGREKGREEKRRATSPPPFGRSLRAPMEGAKVRERRGQGREGGMKGRDKG